MLKTTQIEGKVDDNAGLGNTVVDLTSSDNDDEDLYDEEGNTESDNSSTGTYPSDCYSFMAIHGPFDKNVYFYFGFLVWAFQITFLILLVLRVAHPTLSTNENDDNPDQGQREGFQLANFVPSNNNNLSRATQYMALVSYCFFADASVRDVVVAIETFPNLWRINRGDRVYLLISSCLLRLVQGLLATVVAFLLVINTSDVIDIILNFTAVNFISDFDDIAFQLCKWEKYGPRLKAEAERIETMSAPACIFRKYQHIRYCFTVVPLAFALLTCLVMISWKQHSLDTWLTTKLRVQFKQDPLREEFNGCYNHSMRQDRRVLFESYEANAADAKFGYCQDNKKWFLFKGNKTSACDTTDEEVVAFSSKTYAFDVSAVFDDTWFSTTGTPLELYFFDDQKNDLLDTECQQFLGDGICDDTFNIFDHNYDNGDCCGTTCHSMNCGTHNKLSKAFNSNIPSGNGYHKCEDPSMKPITIKIDNVYIPTKPDFGVSIQRENVMANYLPIDPLLKLDCEGRNVLMVNIHADMKFQTERVMVPDGAKCKINVQNATGGLRELQFVNYTIYHGNEESIETEPIVILQADSNEQGIHSFQRVPECFLAKLNDHVNNATIYTSNESSNKAIEWLVEDFRGFSSCEYDTFLERYALATLNFAAPVQTVFVPRDWDDGMDEHWIDDEHMEEVFWISPEPQCEWASVLCVDGRVYELDLALELTKFRLHGTIPTELGLLKNNTWLDLSMNNFYGSIPTQIGEWKNLKFFAAPNNGITGTIPTELADLPKLEHFLMVYNQLSGSIPSEIGKVPSLRGFFIGVNDNISGTIPNEIGGLSTLEYLYIDNCALSGTLPTMLGALSNSLRMKASDNFLTGTIPSELGSLVYLEVLQLHNNVLTGSIPIELLDDSILFEFSGNNFSNLIPVDGTIICSSDDDGENYCNCNTDCTFGDEKQCACAAAQSCCNIFLYQKEECIVCDDIENPEFVVKEYTTSCFDLFHDIKDDVVQFGDKEKCDGAAKTFFEGVGCRCYEEEEWEWEHDEWWNDHDWDENHDDHDEHSGDDNHDDNDWDDNKDAHDDHSGDDNHDDNDWDDNHDNHNDHSGDENHDDHDVDESQTEDESPMKGSTATSESPVEESTTAETEVATDSVFI